MGSGLNVPVNDDNRRERLEELLAASSTSTNTDFGRHLIDAAHEIWEQSDADDPIEALRDADVNGDGGIDYDPDERRSEKLDVETIRRILDERTEPAINPLHIPDGAVNELYNLDERIDLCMAAARAKYETFGRASAETIVVRVLGRGSNDYYIDPDRADVPGEMVNRGFSEPRLPTVEQDKATYTSSSAYLRTWVSLVNQVLELDLGDLSDIQLARYFGESGQSAVEILIEQGERLLILRDGAEDMIRDLIESLEQFKREVDEEAFKRAQEQASREYESAASRLEVEEAEE
ncbi:hypothetical protein [Haloarcula litorea]|uniref:hypothetical protein n=1 Tax=Haloarcula litorea TaxID=3032579 RepID=UPI0023E874CD|nr:hypothetical protein [Halomicroarcula sp. GDY20]